MFPWGWVAVEPDSAPGFELNKWIQMTRASIFLKVVFVAVVFAGPVSHAHGESLMEQVRGDASPYEFAPDLLRGPRPASENELRNWARQYGITTILSLDNYHDDPDLAHRERIWTVAAGLEFVHFPMHHLMGPDLEQLNAALSILESRKGERIYIHCKYGKDRTGLVVAAW